MKSTHLLLTAVALGALVAACESKPEPSKEAPAPVASATAAVEAGPSAAIDPASLAPFKPALPSTFENKDNPLTEEKVQLGKALYFDKRLSKDGDVACNSCHQVDKFGVDGTPTSEGHKKQKGGRNSPTVFNAAGHFAQFWDGRAKDVEEQAKGPVLNPIEMAMESEKAVVAVLAGVPAYKEQFAKAFPGDKDPITFDNMAKAIGAYERKLSTPSRWDKYLAGDKEALTREEKIGFNTFVKTGCQACHTGTLVGGGMYQKLGLVEPWKDESDLGRAAVTKNDAEKMFFKVPSLRNVEKTAPYFHNGSVSTLEEAVSLMGKHQLGKALSKEDVASIVTWLKTLTGEAPKDLIAQAEAPASAPTPADKAAPKAK